MNKSQLFALLTMTVLGLVIVSIIVYDSDASIEMQQCGGCHNPDCTQEMAGSGIWDAIFNAVVPDQRGTRAVPCSEGHLRGCTECHARTHGSKMLHAGMTDYECSRCHVLPTAPMYMQCVFCHGNYQHADPGVTGDCISCHPAHAADTSVGCGDCHAGEYADFTKSGGKHATKDTSYDALRHKLSPTTYSYESPLLGDGCYSCHETHTESMSCTNCHKLEHGYELADCTACHNPHAPRTIKFDTIASGDTCMLCHKGALQEFIDHPTLHAAVKCADCHIGHTGARACIDCHADAHDDIVVDVDCMTCHTNGHSPI